MTSGAELHPTILIVEDDDDVRQFMEMLVPFVLEGYRVAHAWNGIDALAKLETCQPILILLDMHMPGMNGWTFRERQMQDPRLKQIPVIAITADPNPRDIETALNVPCFSKPLLGTDFDKLFALIRELTNHN